MEQQEFLEKNVFIDLKNLNENFEEDTLHYFSASDFDKVLQKVEYFGIGVYTIDCILNGKSDTIYSHETFHKKATDANWYKKAFMAAKKRNEGFIYSATYKVSGKLLAR